MIMKKSLQNTDLDPSRHKVGRLLLLSWVREEGDRGLGTSWRGVRVLCHRFPGQALVSGERQGDHTDASAEAGTQAVSFSRTPATSTLLLVPESTKQCFP